MKFKQIELFNKEKTKEKTFQGCSEVTKIKEIQIYGTIRTRLLQRKNAGDWIKQINVYDIFCGDGKNIVDSNLIWGSPIEIINAISDSKINECKKTKFFATDMREVSVERLQKNISNICPEFEVECFAELAENQVKNIEKYLKGKNNHAIILVDPNGPGVMPYIDLTRISKLYNKRADIFINISETAINRVINCKVTSDKNWWAGMNSFYEIVSQIMKNYREAWLRLPIQGDKQKWRYICFWTYSPPKQDWQNQNMVAIKSTDELKYYIENGA